MSMNKSFFKVTLTSFITLFAVMFMASGVYADVNVSGKIKTSDGSTNGAGATVSVTCNTTTIPTVADDPSGNFGVVFTDEQCAEGDTITVNASLNGESATVNSSADKNTNFGNIILAAIAVPEFGLITGLIAAGGSGLAYLKMRKHMA